jgi:Helitron helicase-like domain at N-terminus
MQYICDIFSKMESSRLRFIEQNQHLLAAYLFEDFTAPGEERIILPASHTGSPRYMRTHLNDAMRIVDKYGNPDIFITFTANPNWDELVALRNNDYYGERAQGWEQTPDMVRLFRIKLRAMISEIKNDKLFGPVEAYTYVIEFQKRGLPHAHIVVWLEETAKPRTPDDIDRIVSAQIPNNDIDALLRGLVVRHMLHNRCGENAPCWRNGKCRFNFPFDFANCTSIGDDGKIVYKRPNNSGDEFSNRHVATYNTHLLKRYRCHINVSIVHSADAVKYLFYYIAKGVTTTEAELVPNDGTNEVRQFIQGHWYCAPEAMWRIFCFPIQHRWPAVDCLDVHLPAQSNLYGFEMGPRVQRRQSKLLSFFDFCNQNPFSMRNVFYVDVVAHCTWSDRLGWQQRRRDHHILARLPTIDPNNKELFFLRLLLLNVPCPRGYNDLMQHNGIRYATFEEAARARNLTASNFHAIATLEELTVYAMPSSIRRTFASLLIYTTVQDIEDLWVRFSHHMSEDLLDRPLNERHRQCLDKIDTYLREMGSSLSSFEFLSQLYDRLQPIPLRPSHRNIFDQHQEFAAHIMQSNMPLRVLSLNEEQMQVYMEIMSEID